MATFDVYNLEGKVVGSLERPALFDTPVDKGLIHRYVTWVRNVLRPTISQTKTRGEVSGGGRKPWRQKGTGRARVGSSRSPIWRGGGIIFGPNKERNWATRLPRTERRKALFSALADKANQNQIIVLDEWTMEEPKTQKVVEVLRNLNLYPKQSVLHLHPTFNRALFASTRNLPTVDSRTVQNLNIIDLLTHDILLLTRLSVEQMNQHFQANHE